MSETSTELKTADDLAAKPGTGRLAVDGLCKHFTLHHRGGQRLPVLRDATLHVAAGDCVALVGPSGAGKSTLLRCIYGNYLSGEGSVRIHHQGEWVELTGAPPRTVLQVRRHTLGYVSQFLRVIPRLSAEEVVCEPLVALGTPRPQALEQARDLLARLNLPQGLWGLPPATFSGGEQQRVNIARGLIGAHPVLLLDEPTASLDAENRDAVVRLIDERRTAGCAIVGIFHDELVRDHVATRQLPLLPLQAA